MTALETIVAEVEKFAVSDGPTIQDDPPLGWPDDGEAPLDGTVGLTTGGVSNTAVAVSGLTPGAFTGGFFSLSTDSNVPGSDPPDAPAGSFGDGIQVVSNTATIITLAEPLTDGAGAQTAEVDAASNGQDLFDVGDTDLAVVLEVKNVTQDVTLAVDASVSGHNLATGQVGIGTDPAVDSGDTVRFSYRRAGGAPAAGLGFLVVPERAADPAQFSTGKAWADAYTAMFLDGTPTPAAPAVAAATQACRTVIDSLMAVPGMGPVALNSGLAAFWAAVSSAAATIWPTISAISAVPPPGVFAAGQALAAVMLPLVPVPVPTDPFSAYQARARVDAALMAGAIHTASQGGQIITQPGSTPVPVSFVLL